MMMKKVLIAAVALTLAMAAAAQEKNFIDQNYIEVTGHAELDMTPDEIYVRINIDEKDNKGKVSVDQQERDMFQALRKLGIDFEKNMVVQDQSADLKTYLLRKNTTMTSKTYQLKLATASEVGNVFRALAELGVSDVNIEKVNLSNMDEVRQQVRAAAAKAARQNAGVLAEAVGRTAGKALYIQDMAYHAAGYANVVMTRASFKYKGETEMADSTQLEFEKIKVEHSVSARFALE